MLLLSFLLPSTVAFLALVRYWPTRISWREDLLMKLSLAAPIGLGFNSVWFFLWSVFFSPAGRLMVGVEIALLLVVGGYLAYQLSMFSPDSQIGTEPSADKFPLAFRIAFAISAALALRQVTNLMIAKPHGHWDAWAIWNLRARFLFRSGENWENAFSPLLFWSSPDHPLNLPAAVANGWKFAGEESVLVPMIIAFIFVAATIGILYATVSAMTGRIQAVLAGLFLVGTPLFVYHGASQYADIPCAFFFLACVGCLARYDTDEGRRIGWLMLAGLMAALAAWTKNEGILFLVAIILARGVVSFANRSWHQLPKEISRLVLGGLPVLIPWAYFKIWLAPSSGLWANQDSSSIMAKLLDLSRYQQVRAVLAEQMAFYGEGMLIAIVLYLILVGLDAERWRRPPAVGALTVIVLMLLGYFAVFVTTPEDLAWHLSTSIHRLLLQIWPLTIYWFCLIAWSPERNNRSHSAAPV